MKIAEPAKELIARATGGDLAAVDALLAAIQPGVYNLAVRMLGNRDDAADASQEILIKVLTHLSGFRGEAAFATWVFQVARNHLLTVSTRTRESPEVSLEAMGEYLQKGLAYAESAGEGPDVDRNLGPEERLQAKQIALACSQNMLMTLDRDQRLSYILDTVFELNSQQAAAVLDISADNHRQRVARARAKLNDFTGSACGLVSETAACRCEKQVPAMRRQQAAGRSASSVVAIHTAEMLEAERNLESLLRMGDAAHLFRAHPDYRAPERLRAAVQAILSAEGFLSQDKPAH